MGLFDGIQNFISGLSDDAQSLAQNASDGLPLDDMSGAAEDVKNSVTDVGEQASSGLDDVKNSLEL